MADEQDTCRICAAPSEPGQPLFHPCKCSGTIRYIHQDCLTTWLAHSKKTSCDVCKHQYSFTKVYAPEMPQQLPLILFLRRLIKQIFWGCVLVLRVIMIAIIWLALLPYVTIWTWRFYFVVGDQIAWWINDRPRPTSSSFPSFFSNASSADTANVTTVFQNKGFYDLATDYSTWRTLCADIFTGQIIASLIVLTFLGGFLLREWIQQNARPADFLEDPVQRANARPARQRLQMQPAVPHDPEPLHLLPHEPGPDEQDLEHLFEQDVEEAHGAQIDQEVFFDEQEEVHTENQPADESAGLLDYEEPHPYKRNVYHVIADMEGDREELYHDLEDRPRSRRRLNEHLDGQFNSQVSEEKWHIPPKGKAPLRSSHSLLKQRSSRGRGSSMPPSSSIGPEISHADAPCSSKGQTSDVDEFEFSFQVNRSRSSGPSSTRETSPISIDAIEMSSSRSDDDSVQSESAISQCSDLDGTASTLGFHLRRPPLPTALTVDDGNASNVPFTSHVGDAGASTPPYKEGRDLRTGGTPLSSPGLATYRAPEQLASTSGAGSSRVVESYFDADLETTDEDDDASSIVGNAASDTHTKQMSSVNGGQIEGAEGHSDGLEHIPVLQDALPAAAPDTEDEDDQDDWDDIMDLPAEDEGEEEEEEEAEADIMDMGRADGDHRRANNDMHEDDNQIAGEEGNDEPEANIDDDMDGALEEAIGIRGPIATVFQNAALLIFLLDTTIGLAIWLPFTIGKTCGLLFLEPHRVVHLIHLPIRIIRLVTDPMVNLIVLLLQRFAVPAAATFINNLSTLITESGGPLLHIVDKEGRPSATTNLNLGVKWTNLTKHWERVAQHLTIHSADSSVRADVALSVIDGFLPKNGQVWQSMEPFFAAIGKEVRLSSANFKTQWFELASGDATINRIFAIALGYALVGIALFIYLNAVSVASMQNAGRAVRNLVRQHLVVLKVAGFVLIELVLFPLACGIMLDACTLSMFPNASIAARMAFALYAPLTSAFYHWMIGTMFMYQFVMLLSGCRKIVRPGAMWFIKDPQDQNFHPIRDILERPTLVQLRKLSISACMYFGVVVCGIGSIVLFCKLLGNDLLPLRWNIRKPLSEIPIDLLFMHIFLPATLHHFRPKKTIRSWATNYWRWSARQFRITSYMFGGRYPAEEHAMLWPPWTPFYSSDATDDLGSPHFEGGFLRVPAEDNIALRRELRATAEVNEKGEPVDEEARQAIEAQINEAEEAKRDASKDYTIVYKPPHFRYRLIGFITTLWLSGAFVLVLSVATPILLGRHAFALFVQDEVHDGYSLAVGFYLLWACYVIGKTFDRMDKRRQRTGSELPRAGFSLYVAKRTTLWATSIIWMLFWMGIIIPILVALTVEFYIVFPLRLISAPHEHITVRIAESWAIGLVYTKMAIYPPRFRALSRVDAAVARIKANGWRRPDAIDATMEIIGPVIFALLTLLIMPLGVIWGLQRVGVLPADGKFIFVYIYPSLFVAAAFGKICVSVVAHCATWAQSIRDSEFLVEMRLRNLDSTPVLQEEHELLEIKSGQENLPLNDVNTDDEL